MKKFKLLTAICLAFIMVLCLGITTTTYFCEPKSAYADTTATDSTKPLIRVNFYIAGNFYKQYALNQGQYITKPTGFCENDNTFVWLNKNNANQEFDFDNTAVATTTIELELEVDSGDRVVMFYETNTDYDPSVSMTNTYYLSKKDPYRIAFISIVPRTGTVSQPDASKEPSKDGYNFSHWGTSDVSDAAYDFSASVTDNILLYPKYIIQTFTVQFLVEGTEFNKQTVNYDALAVDPGVPTVAGKVFSYWYVQGDATKTPIVISSQKIKNDYVLVAWFTSADLKVTISNFIYGKVVSDAGDEVDISTPLDATNGNNFVFNIQLNDNYNEFNLLKANIGIVGTYVSYNVEHPDDAAAGFYKVTIRTVRSDLQISVTGVTINKYDVTMSNIDGLDLIIVNDATDYTVSNNVYTLDFTVDFKFKLQVNTDYELASGDITVSNCTYDEVLACWILDTSNADKTIVVQGDVREVVTITLTGVNNVTVTITDSTYIITSPDDYVYRVEKGKSIQFLTQTTGTYLVKSVVPASRVGIDLYMVTADETKEVNIVVVDTVKVTMPESYLGVDRVEATGHISLENKYDGLILKKIYTVELGATFTLTFTMRPEYSQAVLDISYVDDAGTSVGEVDINDFPTAYIRNISANGTISVAEPNLNTYVVTLNNNAMVTLTDNAGTNRAVHAGSVTVNIAKSAAYSNATISGDNITILGSYTSYNVAEDNSSITINGITSAITLYIENLLKNKYSVTLNSSNVYGSLTPTTNGLIEYGTSFAFMVNLEAPYSKTAINDSIFEIVSTSSGIIASNELTISGTTVSIQNITQNLTVSLRELTLNTYKMTLPTAITNQFTVESSGDTVEHNGSYSFSITLGTAYTKNAETMTVTRKIGTSQVEIKPVIEGNTLTYTVNNIVSNLTFSVSTLTLNIYSIEFYNTDPVELYRTVKVEHNQRIIEIPTISKEGSTFNFWATDELGTTPMDFNSPVWQDTKCYASFATRRFTIRFKDEQGYIDKLVLYGKACEMPTIRTKVGWDNAYWDIPDTININAVTRQPDIDENSPTAEIIHAVYIQNVYTVLFKNGDTVHSRQMILHGEAATTPENPTRRGHDFRGWNKSYSTITENTTIEAKFDVQSYQVQFYNCNNGNMLLSFNVNYGEYIFEPQQNADNRSKYTFRYKDLSSGNILSADKVLEEGYVLEGWYEDDTLALKYNFDETVDVPPKDGSGNFEPIKIYGNMQVTKMLVTFYVDGRFYTEKAVEYRGNLINIPAVPHKVGYDQTDPVWIIRGGRIDYTNITTDIQVDAKYEINEYTVKFVFPGGKETFTRTITHGGSIANVPLPATRFGEIIIYDKDAARYVTDDQTIYIKVIDLVPYLVGIAAAGALALVVVGMAIAITTMKRNRQDSKKMEQLIKDIREQDKRLTQINERKLRAQVDAEMKRKEKINKNKFLE